MESFKILKAANGSITASAGPVKIHSSYNPEKEAERYINKLQLSSPSCILITGTGLGYLETTLQKEFPDTPIIAIHLHPATFRHNLNNNRPHIKRWHPDSPYSLETFLAEYLNEDSTFGLKIISWPPACKAWPQKAAQTTHTITAHIRRHSGNITTTAAFGRIWLRNILRNYLQHDKILSPHPIKVPTVICASGPSLEKLIPALHQHRSRYLLWALPSSMAVLNKARLKPDMIFSTDPGFWAQLHMRHFPPGIPIAMALCSRPLHNNTCPPLPICQKYPGEQHLIASYQSRKTRPAPPPGLHLPAMGTVAASAVEAWKKLSNAPLFLAGLDLCWNDLLSHARPHSFTPWLDAQASRQNPYNNILWKRALNEAPETNGQTRYGSSHKTYADWFNGPALKPFRQRIARLSPPHTPHQGLASNLPQVKTDTLALSAKIPPNQQHTHTHTCPLNQNQRREHIQQLLASWQLQIKQLQPQNPAPTPNLEIHRLMYNLDPAGALKYRRQHTPGLFSSHKENVLQTIRNINYGRPIQ